MFLIQLSTIILWTYFVTNTYCNIAQYELEFQPSNEQADLPYVTITQRERDKMKSLRNILNLLISETKKRSHKYRTKCDKTFGSIFGTKVQKQLCLLKLKKEIKKKKPIVKIIVPIKKEVRAKDFLDLTRSDHIINNNNYIVPETTKDNFGKQLNEIVRLAKVMPPRAQNEPVFQTLTQPKYLLDSRKHAKHKNIRWIKEPTWNRAAYSSSSETDTSDDDDNPKRFQIVDNINNDASEDESADKQIKRKPKHSYKTEESDNSAPKENKSSEESDLSEVETKRPEKKKSSEDESDLSEVKTERPKKKKKGRKKKDDYLYLQSPTRLVEVGSDSDQDGRRGSRLDYYLPKRYRWSSQEIHELGYYWYNGPQGMFPGAAVT